MVKQQRWSREELKEWLVVIRDHWRGENSEYGPTPTQIRTYKTGRRWEPQPLYKDFVNEFGSYEGALAAVEMKVPPDAQRKTGPTLKTQTEQDQEAKRQAAIRAREAKMLQEAAEERTAERQGAKTQTAGRKRGGRSGYSTLEIIEALQGACDYLGKERVTVAEYMTWRSLTCEEGSRQKPSAPVIAT